MNTELNQLKSITLEATVEEVVVAEHQQQRQHLNGHANSLPPGPVTVRANGHLPPEEENFFQMPPMPIRVGLVIDGIECEVEGVLTISREGDEFYCQAELDFPDEMPRATIDTWFQQCGQELSQQGVMLILDSMAE